jgi:CO dehydrogenase maturation factor
MSKLIAFAGKGGTGKTTLAALTVKELIGRAKNIIAIDADPNNNLGQWLGVKNTDTIMGIVEDVKNSSKTIPAGTTKERFINLKIQEAISEENGFDLITMGKPEGPGCYCYANNLLRDLIEKVIKNYDYTVVDNEAGMEHLSRRLVRKVDMLFIISDYTNVGIRSAKRIRALVDEMDIETKKRVLVINKDEGDRKKLAEELKSVAIKDVICIPYDDNLEEISVSGGTIFGLKDSSPAAAGIKEVFKTAWNL